VEQLAELPDASKALPRAGAARIRRDINQINALVMGIK
jgi:hypothetical protein